MTPNEIARKVINRAKDQSRYPLFFPDELAKEIASAIGEEREALSRYLTFLNQAIAMDPQLVRHRLLIGSTRISTGQFIEEMNPDEHQRYLMRLNPVGKSYS